MMTPHFGMCQWETLGVRLKIGNGFFNPTRIGDFNPTLTKSNTNDSKKRHVAHRREIRFFRAMFLTSVLSQTEGGDSIHRIFKRLLTKDVRPTPTGLSEVRRQLDPRLAVRSYI